LSSRRARRTGREGANICASRREFYCRETSGGAAEGAAAAKHREVRLVAARLDRVVGVGREVVVRVDVAAAGLVTVAVLVAAGNGADALDAGARELRADAATAGQVGNIVGAAHKGRVDRAGDGLGVGVVGGVERVLDGDLGQVNVGDDLLDVDLDVLGVLDNVDVVGGPVGGGEGQGLSGREGNSEDDGELHGE